VNASTTSRASTGPQVCGRTPSYRVGLYTDIEAGEAMDRLILARIWGWTPERIADEQQFRAAPTFSTEFFEAEETLWRWIVEQAHNHPSRPTSTIHAIMGDLTEMQGRKFGGTDAFAWFFFDDPHKALTLCRVALALKDALDEWEAKPDAA
jgi:hypothetical protein